MKKFDELIDLVRTLRSPEGCPWDREQTPESLVPYFIEEVHEAVEAIEEEDAGKLKYELGDVLLHVVFQTLIAEERNAFSMEDVLEGICQKMLSRHPHVFRKDREYSFGEAASLWEREKHKGSRKHILDGVPKRLPELHRSFRMQQKAAAVGFDWDKADEVWAKVGEEMQEFREALASGNKNEARDEFGDILFALVNISRFYDLHPETALKQSNEKFYRRFSAVEDHYAAEGNAMQDATLEELDAVWEKVKKKEKTS